MPGAVKRKTTREWGLRTRARGLCTARHARLCQVRRYDGAVGPVSKLVALRNLWVAYGTLVFVVHLLGGTLQLHVLWSAALILFCAEAMTLKLVQRSRPVWALGVAVGLYGTVRADLELVDLIAGVLRGDGLDLARAVLAAAASYVHLRTLRVLGDGEVRRHVLQTA